jgi:hypothetical protein
MKKFIFKILLFVLIVFGLIYAVNYRWVNTQAYLVIDERYKTMNPPKTIDVCNVGSSHGMSNFAYYDLPEGYSGFNLGRAVQTFEYDLRMLKQQRNRLHEGSVVFVPISYFSFYQRYDDENVLKFEYIYYNLLDPWLIKDVSLKMCIEYKWFPILDITQEQVKYLLKDDENAIAEYEKFFKKNRLTDSSTGLIDEERLLKERDKTVKAHSKYFDSGISEEAVNALHELLGYCDDKGYQCILVTTPYSEIYNEAEVFDESFFEIFYSMVDEFAEEYDIPYWDYSHAPQYMEDIYLFYDDDHLNYYGRELFSQEVIQRAFDECYLK